MAGRNRTFAAWFGAAVLAMGCGGRGLKGYAAPVDAAAKDRGTPAPLDAGLDVPAARDADVSVDVQASADAVPLIDGLCPAQNARRSEGPFCTCPDDFPDLCPCPPGGCGGSAFRNLVCVDMRSDPEHCGACGARCAPAAPCRDGACRAEPSRVIGPIAACAGIGLAVANGTLYWADTGHGTVSSMPKDGGPMTTIASNQGQPTWLRIYGDSLYWIARSAQTLVRAPLAGGGPFVAATSPNAGGAPETHPGINGYTVSPTGTVYFSSGKRIYEASAAGTSRVVIQEDEDFPSGLALDGDKMVFLLEGSGHLHSARLPDAGAGPVECGVAMDDGTGYLVKACELMRSHGIVADSLFARDGRIYYVDNVDVSAMSVALERVNRVVSGDRIGGVSEVASSLNTLTLVGDRAVVMADSYVAETALAPLSPGALVSRNQPLEPPNGSTSFLSIAADATDVYWATAETEGTETTCSIVRVSRP